MRETHKVPIDREFKGEDVHLAKILSLAKRSQSPDKIEKRMGLDKLSLNRAFSRAAATMPGAYERLFGSPATDLRIILDECTPECLISTLYPAFGYMNHVRYAGLNGTKDPALYDTVAGLQGGMVTDRYDAIFSVDLADATEADLTHHVLLRALEYNDDPEKLQQLPLLVLINSPHLPEGTPTTDRVARIGALLLKYREEIVTHIEKKQTPFVRVKENGIFLDTTHEDLPEYYVTRHWPGKKEKQVDPVFARATRDSRRLRSVVAHPHITFEELVKKATITQRARDEGECFTF